MWSDDTGPQVLYLGNIFVISTGFIIFPGRIGENKPAKRFFIVKVPVYEDFYEPDKEETSDAIMNVEVFLNDVEAYLKQHGIL